MRRNRHPLFPTSFSDALFAKQSGAHLYWNIGRAVLEQQGQNGWGAKVIDRLSADLKREFPGQRGFSARNLKYMRALAAA